MNGPQVTFPAMSVDELAAATLRINQIGRERDEARTSFREESEKHLRTQHRLELALGEVKQWRQDYTVAAETAARYAELVSNIHLLSAKAAKLVEAARNDGLLRNVVEEVKEAETSTRTTAIPTNEMAPPRSSRYDGRDLVVDDTERKA